MKKFPAFNVSTLMNTLRRLRHFIQKISRKVPNTQVQALVSKERHGTDYGGWVIKKDSINNQSIIYSFGIGEDISFDLSLINKYNVEVEAFDPTPKVKDWLRNQALPKRFRYHDIGLSDQEGMINFYPPENPNYVSQSILQNGRDPIQVPCKRLSTIMSELSHSHLDILKMDIEGAEYLVIEDIIKNSIPIKYILIEFHHFFDNVSIIDTEEAVSKLNSIGYKVFYISPTGREYSFIKEDLLNQ